MRTEPQSPQVKMNPTLCNMPRAYSTLATKSAKVLRAGRCGVSPVLSGFSNGEIFLPQNGAGEGTAALRARLQPSPPDGRQKLRQAGGAPNRKFLAAPAATPAGFGLSKRPANTQLPVITRRRCNGVSTALQIPLQSAQCVNFPQKHSFPQKHLNCGETMPEFSARYEIAFSARARVCSGGVGESVAVSPVRRRGKVFP